MSIQTKKKDQSPLLRLWFALKNNGYDQKKFLLGQMLTIVDASIQDQEQRKALKDIVQQTFWAENYHLKVEDILQQFKKRYYPNIEDGFNAGGLLETHSEHIVPRDSQNYFPDSDLD